MSHLALVRCHECGEPMRAIYRSDIRDTCTPCGGHSKVDNSEVRQEMHAEYLAKVREARHVKGS